MKKLLFSLLMLSATGLFSSCKDDSKIPAPAVTSVPLIFGKVSSTVEKSYYDYQRSRASVNALARLPNPTRPVFEFTIEIPNQRDVQIKAVEVYKSFQRGTRISPRALAGTYSTFPATVSLSSEQVLTGLQFIQPQPSGALVLSTLQFASAAAPDASNNLVAGDAVIFTFEYILQDGSRVILTPLTDVKLANGDIVKVISGNQIVAPYAVVAKFQTP